MTRAEKIDIWEINIAAVVADYQLLDAACAAARQAGCLDIDGPLHAAIWQAFDHMLARIDTHDWLHWFIWENACGEKSLAATGSRKRKPTPVKTPRHLARLIQEHEDAIAAN